MHEILPDNKIRLRWFIKRDTREVLEIDRQSYYEPWTEADLNWHRLQRNVILLTAEQDDQIVGYMAYELQKARLILLRLAVNPQYRRQGIGTVMLQHLIDKLYQHQRDETIAIAIELQEAAHHFFKANNYYAIKTLKHHFNDMNPPRDGYLFRYQLPEPENREYDWSFILGDEDIKLSNNTSETNTPEPGWDFQI